MTSDLIPRTYPILFWLYRGTVRILLRLITRWHLDGAHNIPQTGACLLTSNHLTMYDPPLVYVSSKRPIYALGAAKYFRNPLFRLTFRIARVVAVRRGEFDREAIRRCSAILDAGGALYIPVEGTRSTNRALNAGKSGVAYLATRANAPIVPVALWGVENITASLKRFKRPEVNIRFGEPIHLPEGRARGDDLDDYTEQIMTTIAAMLPESYRGVYADHPLTAQKLAAPATV